MKKDYMLREKFFWASPHLFPNWPYKSRNAIGVKLDDFKAKGSPTYRFMIQGRIYEIAREKAYEFGTRYTLPFGSLPNIIPLEEFTEVKPESQHSLFETGDQTGRYATPA